ncbi:HD-GYP domain-containing protein [Clostridium hydrogenum]|uniref:HD-GYP domain-containing protein n=1 Tax=Clostridium hydrogenum TaxID=2855764 RepID=UPI001F15ED8D|nr:HD-GYP domain-containing protein [Clostridium hydrogenum]
MYIDKSVQLQINIEVSSGLSLKGVVEFMKMVFVRDLKTEVIIGKSIYNNAGKLLIKSGTKTSKENIAFLKKNMVFIVYVEDEKLEDVKIDDELDEIKSNTLEKMPEIFNNLCSGDRESAREALENMNNLVDYISSEGDVNINLYELKTYDQYTYIHCIDTGIMACFLGKRMGYNKEKLKKLAISALLHDVGKTKIPNELINKAGKLTDEEFKILRFHPGYGKEILDQLGGLEEDVVNGVYQHHEKYDGTGYPAGLKKDDISEFARIISVCDVFTAVSANRAYRKRFDPNEAYELILSGSGTMFDPSIVERFRRTFFVYPLGACVKLSNGIEGYVVKQNENFPDRPIVRVTYDIKADKPISPYEIDLVEKYNIVISGVI